jgi:hypothetical protein
MTLSLLVRLNLLNNHVAAAVTGSPALVESLVGIWFASIICLAIVADPDPGSGAFLTPGPGSGIRNRFFPDLGSRIPNPYF